MGPAGTKTGQEAKLHHAGAGEKGSGAGSVGTYTKQADVKMGEKGAAQPAAPAGLPAARGLADFAHTDFPGADSELPRLLGRPQQLGLQGWLGESLEDGCAPEMPVQLEAPTWVKQLKPLQNQSQPAATNTDLNDPLDDDNPVVVDISMMGIGGIHSILQEPAVDSPAKTTVMLRNVPNNYTRTMLMELLDAEGFAGKYDFVYLPIDFTTRAGLGFAFVNLITPNDAERLRTRLEGFRRWLIPSGKVCSVGWSSTDQQGLAANIERYRNSSVMHKSVPDEHKPVLLRNGVRVPFPKSTRRLWPPHEAYGVRGRGASNNKSSNSAAANR